MSRKAGIAGTIGAGVLGMALSVQAFTSPYSSMAVPGIHNGWSTVPSMVLAANNVWVCTQTVSSATNEFKFAANGGWATNWGGSASIFRVPAVANAITPTETNLKSIGLTNGSYRFTFNDSTLEFRLEWAGATNLPVPILTNMAIIGDFNGWTPNANSALTNHPAPSNYLWSGSLALETATAFQFLPNGASNNLWGAPAAASLGAPASNVSLCGKSPYTLTGFAPGTFRFTLNASNATFAVLQTATQAYTISTMTAQGNFIATPSPPPNMMRIQGTSLWESEHQITNNGTVVLRFAANSGAQFWGATNGTPNFALPASGALVAGLTNYATLASVAPARYRITFDHLTGAFTFRRLYTEAQGINLLKNSGFEQTTDPGGGYAVDWGSFQAWPKRVADGYAPHSGNWCGAIHGRLYPEWQNYGSFAQDVLVVSGKTYLVSAWFKASDNWTADSMQIKMEWQTASNTPAGEEAIFNLPPLTNRWVKYSLQGTAPSNATKAHVVFLCAGAESTGTMQIDDAEMKVLAGRTQNFDAWGALQSYAYFAPDWSITSGKVVWNVPPGRPPAGVFISQYVEGTGNNKAVEIYNGTLATIALTNYVLQQYDNGATNPTRTMALSGEAGAGTCVVVGRPAFPSNYAPDLAIGALPNLLTNKYLTFNGDDVLVLRQGGAGGAILDRVGQAGTNATGSIWSRNTKDRTLSRKSTVFTGTLAAATSAFPIAEWNASAKDDFAGLGSHDISYIDPNEPYTPGGYSLVMNTNAVLMSGELIGGIGDVSFWYRTESMNPAVAMSLESGPTDAGPWTTNAVLADVALSNFTYYAVAVNRADHFYWRIRQTGGATNRFRIDEITVGEYSTTRRLEDFNAWTDPAYALPGDYSRYGWSILDATIAPSSGLYATRAALLAPPDGAVVSPAYPEGVGETLFWAKAADPNAPAYLLLQVSVDGGTNWYTQGAFTATTGTTFATWLYYVDPGARARVVFDPAQNSGDVLLDNFEVRLPALYRNQNFNGWPTRSGYTNDTYQGWIVSNCAVDAQNAYEGQAARLNSTVANYVQSPYLPGGIGSVGFWTRKYSATDGAATISVQLSSDAKTWTTLANVSPVSTNYEQFSWYVGATNQFFLRLLHGAGAVRVMIDDVRTDVYQPRPEVIVTPSLDPPDPTAGESMFVLADVVTRYGASVLSVTGYYRIASGYWNTNGMAQVGFGSYAATNDIPGQAAGTMIRYNVTVWYTGVGALPGTTGLSTNYYTTPIYTTWVADVSGYDVWINEIYYAPYGTNEPYIWLIEDPWYIDVGEIHEFIELCGMQGTAIGGWSIQLAFGNDYDASVNSNNPVYATYVIPSNTVLRNTLNGYGFYVLADQELTTNAPVPGHPDLVTNAPIDQFLTKALQNPTNPPFYSTPVYSKDHLFDGVGVVRLLNQYGHVVYSLCYNGYSGGSDPLPRSQAALYETNSIGLADSGSTYSDFDWFKGYATIGDVNVEQILVEREPPTNVYAFAWHTQSQRIVPANTNLVAPFYMLDPWPPGHFDPFGIYYGFVAASYPSAAGTLYHRAAGGGWNVLPMQIRVGAGDGPNGYVWAQIPDHAYDRLQVVQYVIEVDPNKDGVLNAYLGSDGDGNNVSTIYTNLAAAEASPFTYAIPIADVFYITNLAVSATNVTLWTDGNDFVDPVVNFYVQFATNALTQYRYLYDTNGNVVGTVTNSSWGAWTATNYSGYTNVYRDWTFNVRRSTNDKPARFYRIVPRWP